MKKLINTILFVFIFTNLLLSQSIKVLTKSLVSTESLVIEFTDNVIIRKTNCSYPKLLITVETNLSNNKLDILTKNGRYEIKSFMEDGKNILRMSKNKTKIRIDDQEIIEKISCELIIPN